MHGQIQSAFQCEINKNRDLNTFDWPHSTEHIKMRFEIFFLFAILVVVVDGKIYCGSDYTKMRKKTCTFGGQNSECLGPEDRNGQFTLKF